MKRILALALILGLTALASPAQARYGKGSVDTWLVRSDGKTVGEKVVDASPVPTMTIHLESPFSSKTVTWVIRNRGGLGIHDLTFRGCATGGGVGFRYFRPNGHEVTWRVVHDGYTAPSVEEGDTAALTVRVAWRSKRAERICTLHAHYKGLPRTDGDRVNLHVITN
jgi:ribosomal protein S17